MTSTGRPSRRVITLGEKISQSISRRLARSKGLAGTAIIVNPEVEMTEDQAKETAELIRMILDSR